MIPYFRKLRIELAVRCADRDGEDNDGAITNSPAALPGVKGST